MTRELLPILCVAASIASGQQDPDPLNLAAFLRAEGHFPEAVAILRDTLTKTTAEPQAGRVRLQLAYTLEHGANAGKLAEDSIEEAIKVYQQVSRIDPTSPSGDPALHARALNNLAFLLYRSKQFNEALQSFTRIRYELLSSEDRVMYYRNWGDMLIRQNSNLLGLERYLGAASEGIQLSSLYPKVVLVLQRLCGSSGPCVSPAVAFSQHLRAAGEVDVALQFWYSVAPLVAANSDIALAVTEMIRVHSEEGFPKEARAHFTSAPRNSPYYWQSLMARFANAGPWRKWLAASAIELDAASDLNHASQRPLVDDQRNFPIFESLSSQVHTSILSSYVHRIGQLWDKEVGHRAAIWAYAYAWFLDRSNADAAAAFATIFRYDELIRLETSHDSPPDKALKKSYARFAHLISNHFSSYLSVIQLKAIGLRVGNPKSTGPPWAKTLHIFWLLGNSGQDELTHLMNAELALERLRAMGVDYPFPELHLRLASLLPHDKNQEAARSLLKASTDLLYLKNADRAAKTLALVPSKSPDWNTKTFLSPFPSESTQTLVSLPQAASAHTPPVRFFWREENKPPRELPATLSPLSSNIFLVKWDRLPDVANRTLLEARPAVGPQDRVALAPSRRASPELSPTRPLEGDTYLSGTAPLASGKLRVEIRGTTPCEVRHNFSFAMETHEVYPESTTGQWSLQLLNPLIAGQGIRITPFQGLDPNKEHEYDEKVVEDRIARFGGRFVGRVGFAANSAGHRYDFDGAATYSMVIGKARIARWAAGCLPGTRSFLTGGFVPYSEIRIQALLPNRASTLRSSSQRGYVWESGVYSPILFNALNYRLANRSYRPSIGPLALAGYRCSLSSSGAPCLSFLGLGIRAGLLRFAGPDQGRFRSLSMHLDAVLMNWNGLATESLSRRQTLNLRALGTIRGTPLSVGVSWNDGPIPGDHRVFLGFRLDIGKRFRWENFIPHRI